MCRWLAYSGAPLYLEQVIFSPEHSLIDQSLAARSSRTATNGDGFGIGWYGGRQFPGVYKDIRPAWNDSNLRDLASPIRSSLFLAHVRATTGTRIQRTNCHPFRRGKWLFVHNGVVREFDRLKRDLEMAIAPELYAEIEGSTDSEVLFFLALTFGLADEPVVAVERMAGLVEDVGTRHDVEHPLHMTLGITDGRRMFAFRYSSERESSTLFHSKSAEALGAIDPRLERFTKDTRVVVSEPLTDMTVHWEEIPESTVVVMEEGEVRLRSFAPRPPVS